MAKTYYVQGKPACSCLVAWLSVYARMLLALGYIKHALDIYQLIGGYSKSGGTHLPGGAFDIGQYSDAELEIARNMGAPATWHRGPWQGFMHHAHGILRGCPHNWGGRYQISSRVYGVEAGRNGLANRGRDDGPRPVSGRTYAQGIAWALKQLETLEQSEGILGMTKPIDDYHRPNKTVPVGRERWGQIGLTKDGRNAYSFIVGPCGLFDVHAEVHVSGLQIGESATISVVQLGWKSKKEVSRADVTLVGTASGWDRTQVSLGGTLPKGDRLRVKVRADGSADPIIIQAVHITGIRS